MILSLKLIIFIFTLKEMINLAMVVVSSNYNETAEAGEDNFELHELESKKSLCLKVSLGSFFIVVKIYMCEC